LLGAWLSFLACCERKKITKMETMLLNNSSRFVLLPLHYPDIWSMYKRAEMTLWTAECYDYSPPLLYPESINKMITGLLYMNDEISNRYTVEMSQEFQVTEVRCFLGFKQSVQNTHMEVYSGLLGVETMDNGIREKLEWIKSHGCPDRNNIQERVVSCAVAESILYSGIACCAFWLKRRGIYFKTFNLIHDDKLLQRDFMFVLHENLDHKLDQTRIHEIIKSAIKVEEDYIENVLKPNDYGLDKIKVMDYIKYCGNKLCLSFHVDTIYKMDRNPLDWVPSRFLVYIKPKGEDHKEEGEEDF